MSLEDAHLLFLFLLLFKCDFRYIIVADLLGRLISLCVGVWFCKDIVFFVHQKHKINLFLIKEELSCGSKLLIANLSGQLILGVIKLGIERNWNIEEFGKVSLAITASNMLMMLANALGLVFYPMICKLKRDKLNDFYDVMQKCLGIIMLVLLLIYFPFKLFVNSFMPNYSDAVYYMALAFPSTIYEAKMAILLNNYMKKCREEKWMLIINVVMLIIGVGSVYYMSVVIHNLLLSVSLLVLLLGMRCSFVEIYIRVKYKLGTISGLIIQNIVVALFVGLALYFSTLYAFIFYLIICIILVVLERNSFKEIINILI